MGSGKMTSKKRANQPGYIQKINARGHKYWAKDPNYIDSSQIAQPEPTIPDGMVLSEDDAEKEMMLSIPVFSSPEAYSFVNGYEDDFSHDGWECVHHDKTEGIRECFVKGPSGQHYSMQSYGWSDWEEVHDHGIDMTPVADESYTVKAKTVDNPVEKIDASHGPEHKEFIAMVRDEMEKEGRGVFYFWEMECAPKFKKFNVHELPGGDFYDATIPGYQGITGWDNGSDGHNRVFSSFYSFTLDGQEYVAYTELTSESGYTEPDIVRGNDENCIMGTFHPVDHSIPESDMLIKEYRYQNNYPTINIPVDEDGW